MMVVLAVAVSATLVVLAHAFDVIGQVAAAPSLNDIRDCMIIATSVLSGVLVTMLVLIAQPARLVEWLSE